MIRLHRRHVLLLPICLGCVLRLWHLDWGTDEVTGRFHALHPDEMGLVEASGRLSESLRPALSSYGTLALLLPWLTWPAAELLSVDLFDPATPQATYVAARTVSAAASLLAIGLCWQLGRQVGDDLTALLAAALLAVSVLSVQQAHFYTVDGPFTALALAGVLACLHAQRLDRSRDWVVAGLLVGLCGALRINGLALAAPVAVAAALTSEGRSFGGWARRVATAAVTAAAALLLLQPYMLLEPELYFQLGGVGNLRTAAAIATGQIPRIWTLYDASQIPYWYHLRDLLYHAMGPAIQVVSLAGVAYVAWRRRAEDLVWLVFLLVLLAVVGRLEAKNIRYLTPMIPFFCLGAAALLRHGLGDGRASRRRLAVSAAAVCLAWGALYAAGFARLYGGPEARLEALRRLPEWFAAGARVGYEPTGVHMARLAGDDGHRWTPDPFGTLFNLDSFLLSADKVRLAGGWLQRIDGAVIVDVARARHFDAAAADYPVVAGFYRRLYAGHAGLRMVEDLDRGPALGPWTFDTRATDPSFSGFDHPRVSVFVRDGRDVASLTSAWIDEILQDPASLDARIEAAARQMREGDYAAAHQQLASASGRWPRHHLPVLLRCELLLRQGRGEEAQEGWSRFLASLGPTPETLWEPSVDGLDYVGRTLQRLGADVVGERCRAFAASQRS